MIDKKITDEQKIENFLSGLSYIPSTPNTPSNKSLNYKSFKSISIKKDNKLSVEKLQEIFDDKKFSSDDDKSMNTISIYKLNNSEVKSSLSSSNDQCFSADIAKDTNSSNLKTNKFKTLLTNKRERNAHGANDFDNIQRKIQVNYISFLINLANDALNALLPEEIELKFREVNYNYKRNVSHKYIEKLKRCAYSDILQMKTTPKFFCCTENYNKDLYLKVIEKSPLIKKFFSQGYLKVFQNFYYHNQQPIKEIIFDNIKIILSPKTNNFYDLIMKNQNIKELLDSVVKQVYFNEINYLRKRPFISSIKSI